MKLLLLGAHCSGPKVGKRKENDGSWNFNRWLLRNNSKEEQVRNDVFPNVIAKLGPNVSM